MKMVHVPFAPSEVEEVLELHPSVLKADVTLSKEPVQRWAFVTLKCGTSITETELKDFCANRLSKFLLPDYMVLKTEKKRE